MSVLVRGCAILVEWKVLAYNQKGSWQPYWQTRLIHYDGLILRSGQCWCWLIGACMRPGYIDSSWNKAGIHSAHQSRSESLCAGQGRWEWIRNYLPAYGEQWAARVACFADKQTRLQDCTLVLCCEPGYEEPWVIVPSCPQQVQGAWYRLRDWIEGGFKDFKRGQWGWQHTKMLDQERAERLWLALAVSTCGWWGSAERMR